MASKQLASVILIALAISRCSANANLAETASPTPFFFTETLLPTLTPSPTDTPLAPSPSPTIAPLEGVVSTQVNVREEPSTGSNVLGILPPDSRVQIVGKDPGENWWQIEYPPGRNGKAWVAIEFVRLAETGDIPVVENNELLPANGVFGIILEPVNIRSGPGTDFSSIGTLKPQDSVTVTGKDANGTWFQINFESGPDGKGWISAAFVQVQGVENLPIVAASGAIVGTGTPTEIPFTPTPTLIPAPIDNDSAQAPAKNITLSATGSRSFQYSSDLSSPNGDNEDWIQFIPFTGAIRLVLDCIGNGTVALEVFENNNIVQNMICGENAAIKTTPGRQYIIHIKSNASNGLQYTLYRLWVDSIGN